MASDSYGAAREAMALMGQVYGWSGSGTADSMRARVPMHSPLERLKGFSEYLKGHYSLPALLELSAYGKGLEAEYKENGVPAPKWLPESLRALKAAIAETWRREREEKLRKAEAELEELRSKEERRVEKAKEVERLRKELGYGEEV